MFLWPNEEEVSRDSARMYHSEESGEGQTGPSKNDSGCIAAYPNEACPTGYDFLKLYGGYLYVA